MNKNLSTTLGVFAVFMAILSPIRTDASEKITMEDLENMWNNPGPPSTQSVVDWGREELETMASLGISREDPDYREIEEQTEAAKKALIEEQERERAEAEAAKEEEDKK